MPLIIKDKDWNILKEITIDFSKNLLKQITWAWVDIHSACNTWICAACMCEVESWGEFLDKSFSWEPWFPLWDEEIMTCIWWIKKNEYNPDPLIELRKIY